MNRWPLILPHQAVRNILDRQARSFIVGRQVKTGGWELHDQATVERNLRYVKDGRRDLQDDPLVMTIEVESTERAGLLELPYAILHAAGFRSFEEFYTGWIAQRRRVVVDAQVSVCTFRIVEAGRYLHRDVPRGYTFDPARGVPGEPPALSRSEQERMSEEARAQDRRTAVQREADRESAALHERLRALEGEAQSRSVDVSRQMAAIRKRLDRLGRSAA